MSVPHSHRRSPRRPNANLVSRALLLIAYFSLFSVQLCFRYTSDSFDLDAFRSSFVTASAQQGLAVSTAFHPSAKAHHSILNKRYEPVHIVMDIPSGDFQVAPVYFSVSHPLFAATEIVTTRGIAATFLRGPPPVC